MSPQPHERVPVLEVESLTRSFGGVRAVKRVSFTLVSGELLAMIGPNGAGKTTCFNMLNGQLRPDSGSVRLNGRSILGLPPESIWRLGVGRTFQVTATFASMTVREKRADGAGQPPSPLTGIVAAGEGTTTSTRQWRCWNACAWIRSTTEPAGCWPMVISSGSSSRVALANEPRLLLMDEPTAGMAPRERMELMQLAAEIVRERDIAVLFTEHDMDVVFTPRRPNHGAGSGRADRRGPAAGGAVEPEGPGNLSGQAAR